MNRRQNHRLLNEEVGLQIAPMIDVTMLLLFFFMLSTTLEHQRNNENLELPIADSERETTPRDGRFVILIMGSGDIVLNGASTNVEKIVDAIARDVREAGASKRVVEINADSATPSATIKRLVSAIARGGAQEVSYVIRNEQTER
jgi:biopolymer transport protein ExbD